MARLFFVGGYRTDDSLRPVFREAAINLGYHAALQGHTLIVGSERESTLDYYIVQGARKYLEGQTGRVVTLDVRYAAQNSESLQNSEPFVSLRLPGMKKTAVAYPRIETGTHTHLLAHIGALDTSDVTFAIGGREGTYRIGSVAMMLRKPLLALCAFGGSGRVLYKSLRSSYVAEAHRDPRFTWLSSDWDPIQTAPDLVSLAGELAAQGQPAAAPHSYFLSYSWENVEVADHIELLLRRRERIVIRDQTHVPPGTRIDEVIQRQIDSADTFIALSSAQFEASQWCPNELDYALARQHVQKNPRRVVAITLDDKVPFGLRTDLRPVGTDRDKRENAIENLIRAETRTT